MNESEPTAEAMEDLQFDRAEFGEDSGAAAAAGCTTRVPVPGVGAGGVAAGGPAGVP